MSSFREPVRGAVVAISLLLVHPVAAQGPAAPPGRVAGSAVGEVGERRLRDEAVAGYEPLARIDTRIQNRVQNRLRTRIDRTYDPQANAVSPFAVAEEQNRAAGRLRRR